MKKIKFLKIITMMEHSAFRTIFYFITFYVRNVLILKETSFSKYPFYSSNYVKAYPCMQMHIINILAYS